MRKKTIKKILNIFSLIIITIGIISSTYLINKFHINKEDPINIDPINPFEYSQEVPEDFYFLYSDLRGGGMPCHFFYEISKKKGLVFSSCMVNSGLEEIPLELSKEELSFFYTLIKNSNLLTDKFIQVPENYWDWTKNCLDCGGPAYQPKIKITLDNKSREIVFDNYYWENYKSTFVQIENKINELTNGKNTYSSLMVLRFNRCNPKWENWNENYDIKVETSDKDIVDYFMNEKGIEMKFISGSITYTDDCGTDTAYLTFSANPDDVEKLIEYGFQEGW